ncbi:MAG: hypothetical protein U5P10_07870 [Spirochaetia bacterium]|nr:hypothetical protein [Spirochaetia bacterium]
MVRLITGMLNMADETEAELEFEPEDAAMKNYLYSYHFYNIRRGYYPFPSTALKKLHGGYSKVIKWLIRIGFLEPAPFKYSTISHTCMHYRINRDCFPLE